MRASRGHLSWAWVGIFLSQHFDFVFISIFSFDFEVLYEFSPRGVQKSSKIKWVTVNRHPSPSKVLGKYSRTLQELK